MREVKTVPPCAGPRVAVDRPVHGVERSGATGGRVGGPRRGRPLAVSRVRRRVGAL
jgi:hypothetical protein